MIMMMTVMMLVRMTVVMMVDGVDDDIVSGIATVGEGGCETS